MTSSAQAHTGILGTLGSVDGQGVVRMQDRINSGIDDVWSSLTEPVRLACWYGDVSGDLQVGGEYRARVFASGWEGTGRVEACEPLRRLLLTSQEQDDPWGGVTEVTLAAEGEETMLIWEERGMPLGYLAGYGAGIQVHVEDLVAYLAGRGRCDASARAGELLPAYEALAANLT